MRNARVLVGLAGGVLVAGSLSACFGQKPSAVLIATPTSFVLHLPETGTSDVVDTVRITNVGNAETGSLNISIGLTDISGEHIGTGGSCKTIDTLGPLESCVLELGINDALPPGPNPSGDLQVNGALSGGLTIPVTVD